MSFTEKNYYCSSIKDEVRITEVKYDPAPHMPNRPIGSQHSCSHEEHCPHNNCIYASDFNQTLPTYTPELK